LMIDNRTEIDVLSLCFVFDRLERSFTDSE
jgi:hypothetical protein